MSPTRGLVALYALAGGTVNGQAVTAGDLVLSDGPLDWRITGPAIAVMIATG
jgi:hypothetical protein